MEISNWGEGRGMRVNGNAIFRFRLMYQKVVQSMIYCLSSSIDEHGQSNQEGIQLA